MDGLSRRVGARVSGDHPPRPPETALEPQLRAAVEALSLRGRAGMLIYLAVVVGWGLLTEQRVAVLLVPSALLALLGGARWELMRTRRGLSLAGLRTWRWKFGVQAVASIVVLDCFVAREVYVRPLDAATLVLICASATVHLGGTYAFSPDLRMLRLYLLLGRIPLVAVLVTLHQAVDRLPLFVVVLQALYAVVLGNQLNGEFWDAQRTTDDLHVSNHRLLGEVAAREQAEVELRLAQKLEVVGRLAAGIAHEINTPLQAALSSIEFVREGLPEVLELARSSRPAAGLTDDLTYLLDHLPGAVALADDALARTATIVRSVKELSHPSATTMGTADLVALMRAALRLVASEVSPVADVVLEVGALPPVECHPAEVTQVFMNLLLNASQAIASAPVPGTRGTVRVEMARQGESATVAISDTGPGIPEAVREHLFEPFFTTKAVGQGTGQGLAIARSIIVNRHGGKLTFESQPGHGTTFVIALPLGTRTAGESRLVA